MYFDWNFTIFPNGLIDNEPSLVQVMAWHPTGAKPFPEPMMTQFIDSYIPSFDDSKKWHLTEIIEINIKIGLNVIHNFLKNTAFLHVCYFNFPSHYTI